MTLLQENKDKELDELEENQKQSTYQQEPPAPRQCDNEDEQERAERALDEQFEREEQEQEREVEQDEQALAEDEMPDSYEEIIEENFNSVEGLAGMVERLM